MPMDNNSACTGGDIYLYNRCTQTIETEKVPGRRFLLLFYGRPWGRLVSRGVWSRVLFSRIYGWGFHQRFSRRQIKGFVRDNGIDMSEIQTPRGGFQSFNDFFVRRLKPGVRPIDPDPNALIAPADSRLKVFKLHTDTILNIKGVSLTLPQLLGAPSVSKQFANGICLQFRLAPCDYHRFGAIENGVQGPIQRIGGRLYSVSPLALRHMPAIWGQNHRHWCIIETKPLGPVLQIEVGATGVGSIVQHQPAGGYCTRGQEKGYFQMGGSTLLVIVQHGRVQVDDDILRFSKKNIETLVKYGEAVGRVTG